jgi:hypothetical protein
LWALWWTFGFHKMQIIFWVDERLLASQEGLQLHGVCCLIVSYVLLTDYTRCAYYCKYRRFLSEVIMFLCCIIQDLICTQPHAMLYVSMIIILWHFRITVLCSPTLCIYDYVQLKRVECSYCLYRQCCKTIQHNDILMFKLCEWCVGELPSDPPIDTALWALVYVAWKPDPLTAYRYWLD